MNVKFYVYRVPYEHGKQQYKKKVKAVKSGRATKIKWRHPDVLNRWHGARTDSRGVVHNDFKPYSFGGAVICVNSDTGSAGIAVCSMADRFDIEEGMRMAFERSQSNQNWDEIHNVLYNHTPLNVQHAWHVLNNRVCLEYYSDQIPF